MGRSKRIISSILLFFTISICWGCTEKPTPTDEPTATPIPYYEFQGIRAGAKWTEALAIFGEPENQIQEDVLLTTYTYPHYMVMTAKQGGEEYVTAIRLRSSAVETARGTVVGDSKETVIQQEGNDFIIDGSGNLLYVKEETTLCFMLDEDGTVYAIEYGSISEE